MSTTAPADDTKRPSRTSMEGMIWNANHVLEQALKPGIAGISKALFEDCLGIVLISIVEAGFIFSGNVGSGIALTKEKDGSWSAPCAVGMTGVGWGLLAGGSVKDCFLFLMDEQSVKAITSDNGLKAGAQAELTVGIGRNVKGDFEISSRGVGVPICIAFTKGAFAGFNIEGSVVGARHDANARFYGKECTPQEILIKKEVTVPADKVTMLAEVYDKLDKCAAAATVAEPTPEEEAKKSAAAEEAEKASASVHEDPKADVVKVDAAEEAAKEAEASKTEA